MHSICILKDIFLPIDTSYLINKLMQTSFRRLWSKDKIQYCILLPFYASALASLVDMDIKRLSQHLHSPPNTPVQDHLLALSPEGGREGGRLNLSVVGMV